MSKDTFNPMNIPARYFAEPSETVKADNHLSRLIAKVVCDWGEVRVYRNFIILKRIGTDGVYTTDALFRLDGKS